MSEKENKIEKEIKELEEEVETLDYSKDVEEIKENLRDHAHKGIDTSKIRSKDVIRKWQSGCSVWRNGTQAIAQNVWTKVQFNGENWDIAGEFDSTTNYRFTVQKEGYYFISSCIYRTCASATAYFEIAIYKNGSEHRSIRRHSGAVDPFATDITSVLKLVPDDYIEIYVRQSANAQDIYSLDKYSWLDIYKIY